MGTMVSEVYEALIAASAPEDKAKAADEDEAIPLAALLETKLDITNPEDRWTRLELAAYGVGAMDLALLIKLAFFI